LACASVIAALLWLVLANDGGTPATAPRTTEATEPEREEVKAAAASPELVRQEVAEPPPARAKRLAGRVVHGETGAALPGAALVVHDCETSVASAPRQWRGTSGDDGSFEVDVGGAATVDVEVTRAGCVPWRQPFLPVQQGHVVTLDPARRLVVTVLVDAKGDRSVLEPVAHTPCRVVFRGDNQQRKVIEDHVTDARGEVVVGCLGDLHLVVEREGLPPQGGIFELEPGQERLQVVLRPFGSVTGRVVDVQSGLPLAGATVRKTYREVVEAVADADGRFRIPHELQEHEVWHVDHPGYTRNYVHVLPQRSDGLEIPLIELARTVTLSGTVKGFTGTIAVSAVSEKAWYVHNRWQGGAQLVADGPVRLPDAPAGEDIAILVRDRAGRVATARASAGAPGAVVDFGVVSAAEAGSLHGRVTADDLQGAVLLVRCVVGGDQLVLQERTLPVRDGGYRFEGLVPGRVRLGLVCGDARLPEEEFVLRAGEAAELDLDLGGWIRGEVVDQAGKGQSDAIVECADEARGSTRRVRGRADRLGRFAFAGLAREATWRVRIWGADPGQYEPERLDSVRTGAAGLRFTKLGKRLEIRGRVDEALLVLVPWERLQVQGREADGRYVHAGVRQGGEFVLATSGMGPCRLELFALSGAGGELSSHPVAEAAPIDNVVPGEGEPVLRRR